MSKSFYFWKKFCILSVSHSFTYTEKEYVSGFENLTTSEVSKKIAEGLRANSPSIEILGNSIANIPEDGSSFRINHDGLTYTLTMKNG